MKKVDKIKIGIIGGLAVIVTALMITQMGSAIPAKEGAVVCLFAGTTNPSVGMCVRHGCNNEGGNGIYINTVTGNAWTIQVRPTLPEDPDYGSNCPYKIYHVYGPTGGSKVPTPFPW
jgi:hypothetical protein